MQFWMLCLSTFLFFTSFNMIIPELPSYLTSMGGEDYKGLIISLFTLTAGISRPFSGKLADTVGRIPVMVFGSIVCVICGFMYPLFGTIWSFFLLRLVHGFSTGFQPTGISAYVADLIPYYRRGEAMGLIEWFVSLGFAVGPAIGAYMAQLISVDVMFYTSSAAALLSVLVLVGMKGDPGVAAVLAIASVVCVVAGVAGDMMQDWKVGYILGGTPWRMQIGGMIGVIAASLVLIIPIMLLNKASGIGSDALPAPQAGLMAMMAKGIVGGEMAWPLVIAGMFFAIALILIGSPSPMLISVGMYLPFNTTFAIFVGGLIKYIVDRKSVV